MVQPQQLLRVVHQIYGLVIKVFWPKLRVQIGCYRPKLLVQVVHEQPKQPNLHWSQWYLAAKSGPSFRVTMGAQAAGEM